MCISPMYHEQMCSYPDIVEVGHHRLSIPLEFFVLFRMAYYVFKQISIQIKVQPCTYRYFCQNLSEKLVQKLFFKVNIKFIFYYHSIEYTTFINKTYDRLITRIMTGYKSSSLYKSHFQHQLQTILWSSRYRYFKLKQNIWFKNA